MRPYGVENFKGLIGRRPARRGKGFRQRTCPCCIDRKVWYKVRSLKKRARKKNYE